MTTLFRHLQYTTLDGRNVLNSSQSHDDDFNNGDTSSSTAETNSRDAYEFVAFLLWYLFLVLCCVIPTCCAYRRRRLVEARIQQQQDSFHRIERQNLFILSSMRQSQQHTERIREQRGEKITEKLKETTMTVEECNLVDISGDDKNDVKYNTVVVKVVDEDEQKEGDSESGEKPATNSLAIEYDVEAADPESTTALQLTKPAAVTSTQEGEDEAVVSPRMVPGACAICLCPYETGDEVTWSPREECQHAFHSECIIPWLAKSDEPKCPCCRQDYCDPVPMHELELNPMSLFGAASFANLGDGNEDTVIPHFMRTLEASRLEFLTSLELAAVEASARARDSNNADGSPFEVDGSPFEVVPGDGVELGEINRSPWFVDAEATAEVAPTINSESEATQQSPQPPAQLP